MPITCVLCKKQPVPNAVDPSSTRSFHQFPKKEMQRSEWIRVTGVSHISSASVVCSDHFDSSSYYNHNMSATKRHLLPTAVPVNNVGNIIEKRFESIEDTNNIANTSSTLAPSSSKNGDCNNTSFVSSDNTREEVSSNNESEKKSDVKKMIRLGKQTFCRQEFATEQAWNKFVHSSSFVKKQIMKHQKKECVMSKKINDLKRLVKSLKNIHERKKCCKICRGD